VKSFRKNTFSFLTLLLIITNLSSCSWMGKRKALFDDESPQTKPTSVASANQMVTKSQYDQLLSKYEELLNKINNAEKQSVEAKGTAPITAASTAAPAGAASVKPDALEKAVDQSKLISQLSKINPTADLAETVDVFGRNGVVSKDVLEVGTPPEKPSMSDKEIENQLLQLQKANKLVKENKVDSALILLKELEESSNRHIRVRAKYYLAEMLFRQNEYDLALQMYEEIVHKYAFSGLVINSLGRLIVCSEKLKLSKKQERYYSILHDFFES
jgi:tetratricopeptide (TPR) repeat protein